MNQGRLAQAEACFKEALRLQPDYAEAHNDLANTLRLQGRLAEAVASYRDALRLRPDIGLIHQNLGTALAEQGTLAEAEASLREAVRLQPQRAEAHHDFGIVLQKRGLPADAIACFEEALRLNPGLVLAHVGLGNCLAALGRLPEAVHRCGQALRMKPDSTEAMVGAGVALQAMGRIEEAASRYRDALRLKPDSSDACYHLATALVAQNRLDDAAAAFRETLRLKPAHGLAHNNLGNVFLAQGRTDEATRCFEEARCAQPDFVGAHSNVLFALNFRPDVSPASVLEAHVRWNDEHAAALAEPRRRRPNQPTPDRRLRVGYVSADFRAHSVSLFIEPVLESHDRKQVEVFCYADVLSPDPVTERLKALTDRWIATTGRRDEFVAEKIRADEIDILVDLAGHTGGNRLLAFARKPAPVQTTWLGYPNTTGMTAMDYRITDAYADPPGMTERYYAETLVRMPDSLWCYRPDGIAPKVNALPAPGNGHLTFGSFNNFAKVTPRTREFWAKLLLAVPKARLLVAGVPTGEAHTRVLQEFGALGISAERLELVPRVPRKNFFELHQRVDVALDPFPFQGGTTTCESLWMGVPVISLAGKVFAARAGVSLLTNVGMPELIARTPEEFVAIGVRLAGDLGKLTALRQGLRAQMARSPLTDARRFTANLEALYRKMWEAWCRQARK